jgi:hypothetical protein
MRRPNLGLEEPSATHIFSTDEKKLRDSRAKGGKTGCFARVARLRVRK